MINFGGMFGLFSPRGKAQSEKWDLRIHVSQSNICDPRSQSLTLSLTSSTSRERWVLRKVTVGPLHLWSLSPRAVSGCPRENGEMVHHLKSGGQQVLQFPWQYEKSPSWDRPSCHLCEENLLPWVHQGHRGKSLLSEGEWKASILSHGPGAGPILYSHVGGWCVGSQPHW